MKENRHLPPIYKNKFDIWLHAATCKTLPCIIVKLILIAECNGYRREKKNRNLLHHNTLEIGSLLVSLSLSVLILRLPGLDVMWNAKRQHKYRALTVAPLFTSDTNTQSPARVAQSCGV